MYFCLSACSPSTESKVRGETAALLSNGSVEVLLPLLRIVKSPPHSPSLFLSFHYLPLSISNLNLNSLFSSNRKQNSIISPTSFRFQYCTALRYYFGDTSFLFYDHFFYNTPGTIPLRSQNLYLPGRHTAFKLASRQTQSTERKRKRKHKSLTAKRRQTSHCTVQQTVQQTVQSSLFLTLPQHRSIFPSFQSSSRQRVS